MTPAPTAALTPAILPGSTASLGSEDQLCLLLARGQLTPELQTRALEFLAAPLHWPLIQERACNHQVYPLLYRNLRDLGFPGVPEATQAELKGLFLANGLRNQLLAEELARLLSLLGEAGIRVIPLKGVTLAQSLYGDPDARVCLDIDILVEPADLAQAMELIFAFGYRAEISDPYFAKLVLRHGRHYGVVREYRGVSFLLEVHWILVQHSSRNNEAVRDLWAEARPRTFFGVSAFSLSPEWEFLYLCMHAADHGWQNLKWLVDIHQIVVSGNTNGSVDWQKAMAKAKRVDLDLVIRETLAVCSLLLGTPVPASCSPATLPGHIRIFPHDPLPDDSPESTLAFRHLRVLRRPLDKLGYFATVIFAPKPTDREFLSLPPSLGFLYYVIRPLRLAFKWVGQFLRRLSG